MGPRPAVTYVFPAYYNVPIGGYHVHYEYANRLAVAGYRVTLLFPQTLGTPPSRWRTAKWALGTRLRNRPLIRTYPIHPRVRTRLVPDLSAASLPDADILVATAWQTAEALAGLPPRHGRPFYVVYDHEYLMTADAATRARIEATYRAGFTMVATSSVVADTIRRCGGTPAATVPCGLDLTAWGCDVLPEDRSRFTLGFPLRSEPFKGAADAIEVAIRLRNRYGDALRVECFGRGTAAVPGWITSHGPVSAPALRAFYNRQSVFLLPSRFEGWGLPAIEAMACGAALVTADNGGSRDYAHDGETALVAQPGQPGQLHDAVSRLFDDEARRIRLARAGQAFVRRFTWDRAFSALERVFRDGVAPAGVAPAGIEPRDRA